MRYLNSPPPDDPADRLSPEQSASFLGSSNIQLVQIETGDSLWRFVSERKSNKFSDYWIESEEMRALAEMFRSWNNYDMHVKKEVVRNNLAILEPWKNNLSWRMKITFKKPVYAYLGSTGPQKHFANDAQTVRMFSSAATRATEHRIGGFRQIVIPRFKGISDRAANEFADVSHFVHL